MRLEWAKELRRGKHNSEQTPTGADGGTRGLEWGLAGIVAPPCAAQPRQAGETKIPTPLIGDWLRPCHLSSLLPWASGPLPRPQRADGRSLSPALAD